MKKAIALTTTAILLSLTLNIAGASAAEVFPKDYNTEGTITFEAGDEGVTPPVDPENPDPTNPVDPTDPRTRNRRCVVDRLRFKIQVWYAKNLDCR